jgi:hypothetical protein
VSKSGSRRSTAEESEQLEQPARLPPGPIHLGFRQSIEATQEASRRARVVRDTGLPAAPTKHTHRMLSHRVFFVCVCRSPLWALAAAAAAGGLFFRHGWNVGQQRLALVWSKWTRTRPPRPASFPPLILLDSNLTSQGTITKRWSWSECPRAPSDQQQQQQRRLSDEHELNPPLPQQQQQQQQQQLLPTACPSSSPCSSWSS